MKGENKRAAIVGMSFIPVQTATVEYTPGSPTIYVMSCSSQYFPVKSAEYKETDSPGEAVSQQMSAILTDISFKSVAVLRKLIQQELIIILHFSNHERRVVGTDQFPVRLSMEENGRPAAFKLSFKRNSPEPAKFLQSF